MAIDDWLCDYCKLIEYRLSTVSLHFSFAHGWRAYEGYVVPGKVPCTQNGGIHQRNDLRCRDLLMMLLAIEPIFLRVGVNCRLFGDF